MQVGIQAPDIILFTTTFCIYHLCMTFDPYIRAFLKWILFKDRFPSLERDYYVVVRFFLFLSATFLRCHSRIVLKFVLYCKGRHQYGAADEARIISEPYRTEDLNYYKRLNNIQPINTLDSKKHVENQILKISKSNCTFFI